MSGISVQWLQIGVREVQIVLVTNKRDKWSIQAVAAKPRLDSLASLFFYSQRVIKTY